VGLGKRRELPSRVWGGALSENAFAAKKLALDRQFPAKMMKHETPSISESTKPIEMKI